MLSVAAVFKLLSPVLVVVGLILNIILVVNRNKATRLDIQQKEMAIAREQRESDDG